jgi:hypothetical protein
VVTIARRSQRQRLQLDRFEFFASKGYGFAGGASL